MSNDSISMNQLELESIEQYENLIAAIPGGIVITAADDEFTILFANQGYYDLVGYEREEHFKRFKNVGLDTLNPDEAKAAAASAKEQMLKSGKFSVKAKLSHKQKGYVWVHFSGRLSVSPNGSQRIYIVIVDIDEYLRILDSLENEQAFNELIALLSDDAFFDYDLKSKTMRFSKNFANRLGVDEIMTDYPNPILKGGFVAPDSLHLYVNPLEHDSSLLTNDNEIAEKEVHLILPNEGDVWYLFRYRIKRDSNGIPIRAIGKMSDITKHKEQIDVLSEMAHRDQLTGLYNKATTERLIKEILRAESPNEKHALLIIDIDNFKSINDCLGHLYGDIVLTHLAEGLKPLFRTDDIIGRIGGDEFFVFIKNYRSRQALEVRAKEVCDLFHRTYSEQKTSVTISASIGFALWPEHGAGFDELYKNADSALYNTKAGGKNGYSFYDKKAAKPYISTRTEIDSLAGVQKRFKDNRIEYVFKLLYDSGNYITSIKSVLQLITESFGFSRGYIFETSPDGKTTSNTFEWCASGISAEIDNLKNIPIEAVYSSTEAFNKTGMFILKNLYDLPPLERALLEPRGVCSLFQFGIKEGGKLVGFIGFDDCVKERIPSEAEIDEIATICHVLAMFLLKHRSSQREMQHKAIEIIMDNMNSLAYVIDSGTYNVLYENQNVMQITGVPAVGKKCYLTYRDNEGPCADCPMAYLSETKSRHTTELYNAKYDIYVRTDATWINWSDDCRACLVNSVDITEYKTSVRQGR